MEGATDQWLLESVFTSLDLGHVSVHRIDDVEVFLKGSEGPFSGGNRGRIELFGSKVGQSISDELDNVRCLVDKECHVVLPSVNSSRLLTTTDFASLPVSLAVFNDVRQVIQAVYGNAIALDDYNNVVLGVMFLFAFRIVRYGTIPGAHSVNIAPSLIVNYDKVEFSREDYVRRFCVRNAIAGNEQKLINKSNDIMNRFRGDPRKYMNYHDYLSMLYAMLLKRRVVGAGSSMREFERVFRAVGTKDRMIAIPVVEKLTAWARGVG